MQPLHLQLPRLALVAGSLALAALPLAGCDVGSIGGGSGDDISTGDDDTTASGDTTTGGEGSTTGEGGESEGEGTSTTAETGDATGDATSEATSEGSGEATGEARALLCQFEAGRDMRGPARQRASRKVFTRDKGRIGDDRGHAVTRRGDDEKTVAQVGARGRGALLRKRFEQAARIAA